MKCIEPTPSKRYRSMNELIQDLENYVQGRSDWTHSQTLNIHKKSDWLAQADIALSRHLAITRSLSEIEWVHVMLSRTEFPSNTKIEARLKIKEGGSGIGFLISVPADSKHFCPEKGYCLWLTAEKNQTTQLFRSNIQVLETSDICLEREEWAHVRIEHVDHKISFFLNGELKFTYVSYLPVVGSRTGLMVRDAEYEIENLAISTGSLSSVLDCLAVPDAFLAHKDFDKALIEYQKIAASFKGQKEGRIALFQAGICRLEQAKLNRNPALFEDALEAFHTLYNTSGAPLEYLGKALVYEALNDPKEEAKCFELAIRKFKHHPLLAPIKEQLHHRLHQFAGFDRSSTFRFLLIIASLVPELIALEDNQKLICALKKDWDHLPFFEETSLSSPIDLATRLSFWLSSPHHIAELITHAAISTHQVFIENAIFALIEMNESTLANQKFAQVPEQYQKLYPFKLLKIALEFPEKTTMSCLESFFALCPKQIRIKEARILKFLLYQAITQKDLPAVAYAIEKIKAHELSKKDMPRIDALRTYLLLSESQWEEADKIFSKYSEYELSDERSPLFSVYGCFLCATKSKRSAHIHFAKSATAPYLPITALLSLYFQEKEPDLSKLFAYEKKYFDLQKSLFEHCKKQADLQDLGSPV